MTANALPRELVASLVEDAITAPSMHNAQPWTFVLRTGTGTLELHGDPSREMPLADPDRRALHIGCGAALFGLRVALAHRDLSATIKLLPTPGDPWHLADVRPNDTAPGNGTGLDEHLAALRPALRDRHTSRFPFSEERVPAAIMDRLRTVAAREACQLVIPGPWFVNAFMDLVHDSELYESADAHVRAEVDAWIRSGGAGEDVGNEGIPAYAFGPRQHGATAPVRDFEPPGKRAPGRGSAHFEEEPQIALLGTAGDTPREWLAAGQALHRVLLRATLDGLATSLMSQPLEWPELRTLARDPESGTGFVQMVLRLGYGPRGRATPRRPVSEVLTFA
ncbi:nitroreductase [Streptomyces sp. NBC_00708]